VGSNPTPSAKSVDIIEQFGTFSGYAQPNVQSVWGDTDSIGLVVFAFVLIIFFIAAARSMCRKHPPV
jgi:hypothetical protein